VLVESLNNTASRSRPSGAGANCHESGQVSTSTSLTTSEVARRLVKAEEVIRLPEDLAIVFHRNLPPIPCRLVRYYADPEYRGSRAGASTGLGFRGAIAGVAALAAGVITLIVSLALLSSAGDPPAIGPPSGGAASFFGPPGPVQPRSRPLPATPRGQGAPEGTPGLPVFWRAGVPPSPAR
jgi:hypothetical protein